MASALAEATRRGVYRLRLAEHKIKGKTGRWQSHAPHGLEARTKAAAKAVRPPKTTTKLAVAGGETAAQGDYVSTSTTASDMYGTIPTRQNGEVAKVESVKLYHVTRGENVDEILERGPEVILERASPRWQNDYTVSTATSASGAAKWASKPGEVVLEIKASGRFANSHRDLKFDNSGLSAKEYRNKVLEEGWDGQRLGNVVYLYNPGATTSVRRAKTKLGEARRLSEHQVRNKKTGRWDPHSHPVLAPGGSGVGTMATPKQLAAVRSYAAAKAAAAPVPTAQDIADYEALVIEHKGDLRKVESNQRGNSVQRRRSKNNLLAEQGDGVVAVDPYCGVKIGYEQAERDRIYPGSKGGSYQRENLILCCKGCNGSRGNKPFPAYLSARSS